jgi:hypothetical protein
MADYLSFIKPDEDCGQSEGTRLALFVVIGLTLLLLVWKYARS